MAIAHSVAKVCALGEATSCACEEGDTDLPQSSSGTELTVDCSDNIGFGITFATQFLLRRRHTTPMEDTDRNTVLDVMVHNLMTAAQVS